jgi:hypothetical protein
MASQAKRKEKVIDPKKITDSFLWADAFKSGYKNVGFGVNGELLVKSTDLTKVENTIPHRIAYDSTVVLSGKELRASVLSGATANQEAIRTNIADEAKAVLALFLEEERQLLDATTEWENEEDPSKRRNIAYRIGQHTKNLQIADENLNKALYPHRYTLDEIIEKKMLDYASRDERGIYVTTTVLQTTVPTSREFTVEDKA